MQLTRELIQQLRREELAQARQRHPLDRAFAGAELFDVVCERMRWGIAADHPGIDEEQIERILREQLEHDRG